MADSTPIAPKITLGQAVKEGIKRSAREYVNNVKYGLITSLKTDFKRTIYNIPILGDIVAHTQDVLDESRKEHEKDSKEETQYRKQEKKSDWTIFDNLEKINKTVKNIRDLTDLEFKIIMEDLYKQGMGKPANFEEPKKEQEKTEENKPSFGSGLFGKLKNFLTGSFFGGLIARIGSFLLSPLLLVGGGLTLWRLLPDDTKKAITAWTDSLISAATGLKHGTIKIIGGIELLYKTITGMKAYLSSNLDKIVDPVRSPHSPLDPKTPGARPTGEIRDPQGRFAKGNEPWNKGIRVSGPDVSDIPRVGKKIPTPDVTKFMSAVKKSGRLFKAVGKLFGRMFNIAIIGYESIQIWSELSRGNYRNAGILIVGLGGLLAEIIGGAMTSTGVGAVIGGPLAAIGFFARFTSAMFGFIDEIYDAYYEEAHGITNAASLDPNAAENKKHIEGFVYDYLKDLVIKMLTAKRDDRLKELEHNMKYFPMAVTPAERKEYEQLKNNKITIGDRPQEPTSHPTTSQSTSVHPHGTVPGEPITTPQKSSVSQESEVTAPNLIPPAPASTNGAELTASTQKLKMVREKNRNVMMADNSSSVQTTNRNVQKTNREFLTPHGSGSDDLMADLIYP
jgi:hypothetical protein